MALAGGNEICRNLVEPPVPIHPTNIEDANLPVPWRSFSSLTADLGLLPAGEFLVCQRLRYRGRSTCAFYKNQASMVAPRLSRMSFVVSCQVWPCPGIVFRNLCLSQQGPNPLEFPCDADKDHTSICLDLDIVASHQQCEPRPMDLSWHGVACGVLNSSSLEYKQVGSPFHSGY